MYDYKRSFPQSPPASLDGILKNTDMDDFFPQPMAPPPRQKPKPLHKNISLDAVANISPVKERIPDAWPSKNSSSASNNNHTSNSDNTSDNDDTSNSYNTSNSDVAINNSADVEPEMDEREAAYIEDSIEHDEKGEACEWHLAAMLDGTYLDPFSVPARYLIEQEFERIRTVANEFQQLLEENKKRHDENLKRKPE